MGLYASMASLVAIVLSIPKAAIAIPCMAAMLKLTWIAMAMAKIGMMTDLYPRANLKITFVAAPVLSLMIDFLSGCHQVLKGSSR